jgi:hypothetical protein
VYVVLVERVVFKVDACMIFVGRTLDKVRVVFLSCLRGVDGCENNLMHPNGYN